MIRYPDLCKMVEQDLLGMLSADPFIGKRPIVPMEPGDIATVQSAKIQKSFGVGTDKKQGIGFCPLPIELVKWKDTNVADAALQLPLQVDIFENVTLNLGPNGTKWSVRQWATYTAKLMSRYSPQGLTTDWIPERNVIALYTPIIGEKPDENLRGARVNFVTFEADPIVFETVTVPMLSTDKALGAGYPYNVTIQPGVDAEKVFYTIDGSHPYPGNAAAKEWNRLPIPVPAPCFFRARAFADGAGKTGSPSSSIYFT